LAVRAKQGKAKIVFATNEASGNEASGAGRFGFAATRIETAYSLAGIDRSTRLAMDRSRSSGKDSRIHDPWRHDLRRQWVEIPCWLN
jgi:hypothetical protein